MKSSGRSASLDSPPCSAGNAPTDSISEVEPKRPASSPSSMQPSTATSTCFTRLGPSSTGSSSSSASNASSNGLAVANNDQPHTDSSEASAICGDPHAITKSPVDATLPAGGHQHGVDDLEELSELVDGAGSSLLSATDAHINNDTVHNPTEAIAESINSSANVIDNPVKMEPRPTSADHPDGQQPSGDVKTDVFNFEIDQLATEMEREAEATAGRQRLMRQQQQQQLQSLSDNCQPQISGGSIKSEPPDDYNRTQICASQSLDGEPPSRKPRLAKSEVDQEHQQSMPGIPLSGQPVPDVVSHQPLRSSGSPSSQAPSAGPGGPAGSSTNTAPSGGHQQQYMQQSSQIFVFSTDWANRSAEAVLHHAVPSIIAWHETQPSTRKHLEAMAKQHPKLAKSILGIPHAQRMQQQQTHAPPHHMMAMMLSQHQGMPNHYGLPPGAPLPRPGMPPVCGPGPAKMMRGPRGQMIPFGGPGVKPPGPDGLGDCDNAPGPGQPPLSGTKVPNENLNPEQRKLRAQKLGFLSELNKQLFPDESMAVGPQGHPPGSSGPGGGPAGGGGPVPMGPHSMPSIPLNMGPRYGGPPRPPPGGVGLVRYPPGFMVDQMGYPPGSGPPPPPGHGHHHGPPPPHHSHHRPHHPMPIRHPPGLMMPGGGSGSLPLPGGPGGGMPPYCGAGMRARMPSGPPPPYPVRYDAPPPNGNGPPGSLPSATGPPSMVSSGGPPQSALSDQPPMSAECSSEDKKLARDLHSANSQGPGPDTSQMGQFGANGSQPLSPRSNGGPGCVNANTNNLMPVPSPQQIQYLNPLEGQELSIQKQPNVAVPRTLDHVQDNRPPKPTGSGMMPHSGGHSGGGNTNRPVSDPISSLAQMSQQLGRQQHQQQSPATSSPINSPYHHSSLRSSPQPKVTPPPPVSSKAPCAARSSPPMNSQTFGNSSDQAVSGPLNNAPNNTAFTSVKPGAPNTIQYLPSRPYSGPNMNPGMRRPGPGQPMSNGPSLEFLHQRFQGPPSGHYSGPSPDYGPRFPAGVSDPNGGMCPTNEPPVMSPGLGAGPGSAPIPSAGGGNAFRPSPHHQQPSPHVINEGQFCEPNLGPSPELKPNMVPHHHGHGMVQAGIQSQQHQVTNNLPPYSDGPNFGPPPTVSGAPLNGGPTPVVSQVATIR